MAISGVVAQAQPSGEGDSAASPGPGRRWAARAKIAAAVAPVALGALALGGTAQATGYNNHIGFSGYCSLTTPVEYMLQPNGATMTSVTPFATKFTAEHVGSGWEDAYWTTGYNHSLSSRGCDTHSTPKGYGHSLPLPAKIGAPFYATLNETMHSGFSGDVGWDIWLEPPGSGTSNAAMASGGQAHTEVIVIIGGANPTAGGRTIAGAKWSVSNQKLPAGYGGHAGGWHRIYYKLVGGKGSVQNLNLSAIIRDSVVHYGVPASDDWYAIDAGAELTRGSFTVDSYQLSATPLVKAAPAPKPAPKPAPAPKATPGYGLPRVLGETLKAAIVHLNADGFGHVNASRGIPATSRVYYESPAPGTKVPHSSTITIRAKK